MKITDKRVKKEDIRLADLRKGDTFMLINKLDKVLSEAIDVSSDQLIFMVENPFIDLWGAFVSVICLNEGTSFKLNGNEKVIPIEVEILILK